MAVDVLHHISPTQAYAKMAFGQKSKSTEELTTETAYPKVTDTGNSMNSISESLSSSNSQRPTSSSDKSSIGSLLDFSVIERSEQAVDQLVASRKQLDDEIEVSCWGDPRYSLIWLTMLLQYLVEELTKYGQEMNCTDECAQVLQDR